ncbi:MAG: DMT family transporter [Micromonosporaceae bacterium]
MSSSTLESPVRVGGAGSVLLAAALWGTTGTVMTYAPAAAGPVSVGAARIVIGGLLLLAVAGYGDGLRRLFRGGPRVWGLLGLGAVCVAGYQTAYFEAVSRTGVATGTIVTIGSGPMFAGLLAVLLGAARPGRRWLVSTGGAVLGCAALVGGGQQSGVEPVGVLLALISGFGYASYATIAGTLIGRGEDDRAVVAGLFAGAGILLLPVLLWSGPAWLASPRGVAVAAYLGVITTTLGYLWYGRGLRTTPVAVATTLTLAEPAVAAVLGFTLLDERLGLPALLGLVVLAASLLLVLPTRTE